MKRVDGFSLLELLLVLAMGGALLMGVAAMLQSGMRAHTSGTAEAETRQALEFAMAHIGRTLRETQDVLVPNDTKLERDVLAVSLSPVLDANADGIKDADDDKDGVLDGQVRKFVTGLSPHYPLRTGGELPGDATNDNQPGIEGVDDDGDGKRDELDASCWVVQTNDERTCDENFEWSDVSKDWLNAVVFQTEQLDGGSYALYLRKPIPKASNGTWGARTKHVLARDVQEFNSGQSAFIVKLCPKEKDTPPDGCQKNAAHSTVEVTLCLNVLDSNKNTVRAPVCAKRLWRVGGGA